MSFITYREKIFGIKPKVKLLRKRSNGRLKTIESTTDCRAWALEDEVRSEYIKEIISQPVSNVGRFIPPDVIQNIIKVSESKSRKLKRRRLQKRSFSEENLSHRKKKCTDAQKLREIIKDLDDKLEDLKDENVVLKASINKKDTQVNALKECIKELQLKSDEPDHKLPACRSESNSLSEESQNVISLLSSKLEEKSKLYDELYSENEKLKNEVIENLKEEMFQCKLKVDELMTNLEKLESVNEELSETSLESRKKCSLLTKLIAQREGDMLAIQKEINSVKKEFLLQEAEHKEYVEYLKYMYDKKVKDVNNQFEKCKELKEVCTELENNRSELVLNNKLISDNLRYYRTHFYTLVDCNKRLSRSIDLLKQDLNEARQELTKTPETPKLGLSLVHFKQLDNLLASEKIKQSENIDDLKAAFLSAQKVVSELKLSALNGVQSIRAKVSFAQVEIQTDIVKLKDVAVQLELISNDKWSQADLTDNFEPKYKESISTVYRLSKTLLEMEKNIENNHKVIDELRDKIDELTIEYNNGLNELVSVKTENENLSQQIVSLECQQKTIKDFKEQIEVLEFSAKSKDLDIQYLNEEKSHLQEKLDAFMDQMGVLRQMKTQLELLIEENNLKSGEVLKLSEKNDALERRNERLQEEWEVGRNKLNAINDVLYTEQELSRSLEKEVFNLMNEISLLEEKNCSHKLLVKRINSVLGEFDSFVSSIDVDYSGNLRMLEKYQLDCVDYKEVLMKAVFLIKHQAEQINSIEDALSSAKCKLKKASKSNRRLVKTLSSKNSRADALKKTLNKFKKKIRKIKMNLKKQTVSKQNQQLILKEHKEVAAKLKDENRELMKGLDNMKFIICDLEECVQKKNALLRETELHRDNVKSELKETKNELNEILEKFNKETTTVTTNTDDWYEPELRMEVQQLQNKIQDLSSVLVELEKQLEMKTEREIQKRDCCTQVNFRPYGNEVKSIKSTYEKRIDALKSEHEKEKQACSNSNLKNLRLVKDNYEREIKRLKQIHNDNISRLQGIHSDEISVLKTMKEENALSLQKFKEHHMKEMANLKSHYETLLNGKEKSLEKENEGLQKKLDAFMSLKEAELSEINEKVIHEVNMVKCRYKRKIKLLKDAHRNALLKQKADYAVRLEKERIQDMVKLKKDKTCNLSIVSQGHIEIKPEKMLEKEESTQEPTKLSKKADCISEDINTKMVSELDYKWKIQCQLRDEYNRAEQYMKRNLELSSKLSQLENKLKNIEGEVQNEKLKATHMRLQSKIDMATGYLNRSCDSSPSKEVEYSVTKVNNEENFFINAFEDGHFLEKSVSSTNLTVKFIQQCGILHSWNKNVGY